MGWPIIFAGVSAVISLIGLVSSFVGVLIKVNKTLVVLTVTTKSLQDTICEIKKTDTDRDGKLFDHEKRITVLETDNRGAKNE